AVDCGYFAYVTVGSDEASNIRNPLLDCEVTYIGSNNGMEVKFDENSRLQQADIDSIKWSGDSASNRRQMFEEILSIFSDAPVNDTIRNLKVRTEVCLSLNNVLPPIVLPRNLISHVQKFLCPEYENMALLGYDFDLKYDFIKANDKYQLKIHAVLENNAFISCVVSEFDTATVDAFQHPVEFLYCTLFALYENDGIPGKFTHYNPQKELIAPVMASFPGLISILERNPHRCFSFNHKNYSAEIATKDAQLLSNKPEFFKQREVNIQRDAFVTAQDLIIRKKTAVRETEEFKNFKTRYDTFVALAALGCNKQASEIQALLAVNAGIEHPDNPHALEMAAYFDSPTAANTQQIKQTLEGLESPARKAMKVYKEKIDKIITFLTRVTDAPLNHVPISEHNLLAVELCVGLGENPESRIKLMDDTYRII
ncbi:MAG TPA: hypothetical protein VGP47_08440, partial [Parachlamydiaceae bacterium]|nr:hypothetical protein [Parachlamydiaceae bacterium]